MRQQLIIILIFTTTASGSALAQSKNGTRANSPDTTRTQASLMIDYLPTLVKAHPIAKKLMNADFYWSSIEETAPFGNDDGADSYAGFAEWRQTHKSSDLREFLLEQIDYWGYPIFDLNETSYERLRTYLESNDLGNRFMSGIDAAIVAIAFGQLYLEGTIDTGFNKLAQTSIKRQLIPEILGTWDSSYIRTRESQLRIMLQALSQVR